MNSHDILDAMNSLDDALLRRAEPFPARRKRRPLFRYGALAACLCLVVSLVYPLLTHKGGHGDSIGDISALEFNGKYYEWTDNAEVLERCGLPTALSAELAGERVSYLKRCGSGYEESAGEADAALYQYAPAPCSGVYLLREGDSWYAALFCNFLQPDSNSSSPLAELYRVYGIERAEDIAAVTEMDNSGVGARPLGAAVTDRAALAEFYDLTTALESFGNDDFQSLTFIGDTEEALQALHLAFADDRRTLRVETAEGLRFFLAYYPSYDWLEGMGALSYYRVDGQTRAWFAEQLD